MTLYKFTGVTRPCCSNRAPPGVGGAIGSVTMQLPG